MLFIVVLFTVASVSRGEECEPFVPQDFNCDGIVNFLDFSIFTEHWLEEKIVGSYLQLSDDGRIRYPSNDIFLMQSGSYSLSFWCWPDDISLTTMMYIRYAILPTSAVIIGYGPDLFLGGSPAGRAVFRYVDGNGSDDKVTATNPLIEGRWNHIVAIKDNEDAKMRLYVNGLLEGEETNNSLSPTENLNISGTIFGLSFAATYNSVSINNYRGYKNHVLSQGEIDAIYNNGTPKEASDGDFQNIDGWYVNFDEGTGEQVTGRIVESGVGTNMPSDLWEGGIEWKSEEEQPFGRVSYLHGTSDAAINWDGNNPTSTAGAKGSRDFTIAMWLNFDNITPQSIIDKYHSGLFDGYKIEMTSTGTIKATVGSFDTQPNPLELESAAPLVASTWYYIVLSQDIDGDTSLYVNDTVVSAPTNNNYPVDFHSFNNDFVLFPNTTAGGDEGFGIDSLTMYIGQGQAKSANWVSQQYSSGQGMEISVGLFNQDQNGDIVDSDLDGFQSVFLYSQSGENIHAIEADTGTFYPLSTTGTLTWLEGGYPFLIDPNDISFLATGAEPALAQANFSQSIGGYPSTSSFSPETTLVQHLSISDTEIGIQHPVGGFNNWSDIEYVGINNEIIKVENVDGLILNVVSRSVNGILNSHSRGSLVKGLRTDNLFNNVFNSEYKQYRCVAIKNISDIGIAYDFGIYVPQNSLTADSSIKIAIEIPKNQQYVGTSSSWDSMRITDTSLINSTEDFTDANITISSGPNSGQSRIVSSFDSIAGVLVLRDSLPVEFSSSYGNDVSFTIDPGPAQRIASGIISPTFNTDRVTDLSIATSKLPLSIDIKNEGGDKKNFAPNDVVYVWMERSIRKGASAFTNNSFVVKTTYSLIEA
tara:strand:- start:2897 stop:5506 length:2610 start_codon:yes stop_codon:yes gene_type:complete